MMVMHQIQRVHAALHPMHVGHVFFMESRMSRNLIHNFAGLLLPTLPIQAAVCETARNQAKAINMVTLHNTRLHGSLRALVGRLRTPLPHRQIFAEFAEC